MTRGPTFWIVVLAIFGATGGLWLEHRRLNPPPPQGVTVADVGDVPPQATFVTIDGKRFQISIGVSNPARSSAKARGAPDKKRW